uniref:Uncharacterized protein n=1 Tax=Panagrellus redivivus TaxID=6233 RepID=A0A7E4VYL5_PANRE
MDEITSLKSAPTQDASSSLQLVNEPTVRQIRTTTVVETYCLGTMVTTVSADVHLIGLEVLGSDNGTLKNLITLCFKNA